MADTTAAAGNAGGPPCPACGGENRRSARFCADCGRRLKIMSPFRWGLLASLAAAAFFLTRIFYGHGKPANEAAAPAADPASAAAPAPEAEPPRPGSRSRPAGAASTPVSAQLEPVAAPQEAPARPGSAQPAEDGKFAALREKMVAGTIEARGVADAGVLRAMRKVRRHTFVPDNQADRAYEDNALPIEEGKTISQPYIVAFMTEAMRLKPGDKVLELGTGSGYQAAVAAELGADVYSMELIDNLARLARRKLDANGYSRVKVKTGDGYYGWEEHAPFDAIIITCAANHVPPPLLRQLKDGGRLIMPLGAMRDSQSLTLITKNGTDIRTEQVMDVIFSRMDGAVESR